MPKASARPSSKLGEGIVLTLAAEPLRELRAAPLRFLLALRKLAGHCRRIVTYTKSLAALLGCTPNTIRNWRNDLVDAGYIHWMTDARSGRTTILIRDRVEPPSRRALLKEQKRIDALPEPLPWQPKKPSLVPAEKAPWWKFPTKSESYTWGAKSSEAIKPRKKFPSLNPEKVHSLACKWGLARS